MSEVYALDPADYPPNTMSEDEAAAQVGRFVMDATPLQDPAGEGDGGRAPAPPHGSYYVNDLAAVEAAEAEAEAAAEEAAAEEVVVAEEAAEVVEEEEEIPIGDMTVDELKAELDEWGVEYTSADRKPDLQAKLITARAG